MVKKATPKFEPFDWTIIDRPTFARTHTYEDNYYPPRILIDEAVMRVQQMRINRFLKRLQRKTVR